MRPSSVPAMTLSRSTGSDQVSSALSTGRAYGTSGKSRGGMTGTSTTWTVISTASKAEFDDIISLNKRRSSPRPQTVAPPRTSSASVHRPSLRRPLTSQRISAPPPHQEKARRPRPPRRICSHLAEPTRPS